ncbi:MAG TPA: T9SS type A sorting domain-containing protein [Cytophagaceae bacterium]|jgi:hypothetical protein
MKAPLVEAYSRHNPSYAWEEFINMTLFQHTKKYPDTWIGTWSGPDGYSVNFWDKMGETWSVPLNLQGYGYMMDFPVALTHAHATPWYCLINLIGIHPSESGFTLDPKLPTSSFKFKSELLEYTNTGVSTTFTYMPKANGELEWRVRTDNIGSIEADGIPVMWKNENGFAVFKTIGKQGEKTSWTIENSNLGLPEKVNSNQISIHPNPASNKISIKIPNQNESSAKVRLYTLHGHLLESYLMKHGNLEIDINEFPKGLYLVEIETRNGIYTKKILKD